MPAVALAMTLATLPLLGVSPSITASSYGGWESTSLTNGLVEVVIVP